MRHFPGMTESPSWASLMCMLEISFSLSANALVKFAGMCCTTTIPGIVGGSLGRTCCNASVPPVEVPIAITIFVVFVRADFIGSTFPVIGVGILRLFLQSAAALIFCFRSTVMSPMAYDAPGLQSTSIAPAFMASSASGEDVGVSEDMTMVGIGLYFISFRRNVRPSIFGISISSVMTSGLH